MQQSVIALDDRLVFDAEGVLELASTSLSLTHKSHRT